MRHLPAIPILLVCLFGFPACSVEMPDSAGSSEATETTDSAETSDSESDTETTSAVVPLYVTTMTHMEGAFEDDTDEAVFLLHVQQLRYALDFAESYEAKLTLESEKAFAQGTITFGVNVFQEFVAAGQGVGTHADFGINPTPATIEVFAALFAENKALVDAVAGAENNVGCSGGGSGQDWVLAASQAGFRYMNGIVGLNYLSMDDAARPDGWTDTMIMNTYRHYPAPYDLSERIYPMLLADASDFEPDEDGVLWALSGETSALDHLAEVAADETKATTCADCELTMEDVDAFLAIIDEANALRDPSRVAKISVHIPVKLFDEDNEEILTHFFESLAAYQNEGLIQWATQKEVYEAAVAEE